MTAALVPIKIKSLDKIHPFKYRHSLFWKRARHVPQMGAFHTLLCCTAIRCAAIRCQGLLETWAFLRWHVLYIKMAVVWMIVVERLNEIRSATDKQF